ncbi:uncharacterized protein LOC121375488 [Gigantopelta aegis]|uniref:uncharacterized protein LOC121375488 n=1 Tax=Gigantopelta aegis TaxID=1735272 RepID=UPI001B888F27|nr:uncharacterized protein LOC121375488 [Gigantopelta aegis]
MPSKRGKSRSRSPPKDRKSRSTSRSPTRSHKSSPFTKSVKKQAVYKERDYFILSAVSCLFCCPVSIWALMNASKARNANKKSDFATAKRYGLVALRYAALSFMMGVSWMVGLTLGATTLCN